jgi:hypothetical protein
MAGQRFNSGQVSNWGRDVVPSGGAAGQVLSKTSATNYDTTWVNNDDLNVASRSNTTFFGLPNTFFVGNGANRPNNASTLHLWPFVVNRTITVTAWSTAVRVNTSLGNETMRCGIYNWNEDYTVGSLVSEFPTLTVPTGTGLYTTSLSSSLTVTPGRYALGTNVSAITFQLRHPATLTGFVYLNEATALMLAYFRTVVGTVNIANPLPTNPTISNNDKDNVPYGPPALLSWSYA